MVDVGNLNLTILSGGSSIAATGNCYYYRFGRVVIANYAAWSMTVNSRTSDVFTLKLPYENMTFRALGTVGYHNFGATFVPLVIGATSNDPDRMFLTQQNGTGDKAIKGTDLTGSYTWQATLVYYTNGTKLAN